jgi:hypothetical protein
VPEGASVTLPVFVALFVVGLVLLSRPKQRRGWWVTLRRGGLWMEAL